MSKGGKRFTRLTKYSAHPSAVDGCEFPLGKTQSQQQLMCPSVAPCMETCRVSTQKSAEGIVGAGSPSPEGPNVERSVAIS